MSVTFSPQLRFMYKVGGGGGGEEGKKVHSRALLDAVVVVVSRPLGPTQSG